MAEKLIVLNVNPNLIAWILDFLTGRPQYVVLNSAISTMSTINTGAPQGCVLSSFLYTLYTNDFKIMQPDNYIIKFSDDSTLLALLLKTETNYFKEVDCFIQWCEENYLEVNVKKTKETIFDFHINKRMTIKYKENVSKLIEVVYLFG